MDIKELFENWVETWITDEEREFCEGYPSHKQEIACGFYAGFMLAKKMYKRKYIPFGQEPVGEDDDI